MLRNECYHEFSPFKPIFPPHSRPLNLAYFPDCVCVLLILWRMGKNKNSAYQIHIVFRFNPRSRRNRSSRCCYRAREHVDPAGSRRIRHGGDRHYEQVPGISSTKHKPKHKYERTRASFFFSLLNHHFHFPAQLVRRFYPQRPSGQAVVTGVVPSPRYVPSIFIRAKRVSN